MKAVVESVLGSELCIDSSSTDCNIPLSMGIPSLSIGVRTGGGVHTRDERMEKDSVITGMEIFLNVLTKID